MIGENWGSITAGGAVAAPGVCWGVRLQVIVWVALSVAGGLTLLALRSMAVAVAATVHTRPATVRTMPARPFDAAIAPRRSSYLASHEAALLLIEITLSIGIALSIIGLASMAALPFPLMIGALLAQLAVLGSLVAPPLTVSVGGFSVRPAALALAVAQLANAAFFIKAIQALMF